MRMSPVLLAALAATVAVPAYAAPKPKPVCYLVTDAEGDGHSSTLSVLSSPALDITSVDVATGKKSVVAVLRLKTTSLDDPVANLSMSWIVPFVINGHTYRFQRTHGSAPNGAFANHFYDGSTEMPEPAVTVDATSIRFTVPRSSVRDLKKPRQVLVNFGGSTTVNGGNADTAQGAPTLKYADLTPSCLNPT
jgi:hypothetical protein